jgi:hypothetical protein
MASAMSSVLMEQIKRGNEHIEDVVNGRIRQTVQKFIDRVEEHEDDDSDDLGEPTKADMVDSIESDIEDIAEEFGDLIAAESSTDNDNDDDDDDDGDDEREPAGEKMPTVEEFMEIQRKLLEKRKIRQQNKPPATTIAVETGPSPTTKRRRKSVPKKQSSGPSPFTLSTPDSDQEAFVRMQLMNAVLSQCRMTADGEFVVDPTVYDGGVSIVYENALTRTDPRHMLRTKSDRFYHEHGEKLQAWLAEAPKFNRWAKMLDDVRMPLVRNEKTDKVTYITVECCKPLAYDGLSGAHNVVRVLSDDFDASQWLATWHMVNMKFAAQEHFRHRIVTRRLADGVGSVADLIEKIFTNHGEIVQELLQLFLHHRAVVCAMIAAEKK